jgi:YVTN family beta-propeller protein
VRLDDCKFGTFWRAAGPRCIPNPIATISAAVQGCRKLQTVTYLGRNRRLSGECRIRYIMRSSNSNGSRAAWARGVMALCAMLAMGLGSTASPAEAAPFAYVANDGSGTVSVIDTATNTVVATVPVRNNPTGVAVTPDGAHAYVANLLSNNVSVIATATNKVVGTPIPVGTQPIAVAVTPDGTHAYVANAVSNTVSVIATATNMVVATVAVGANPTGVAIIPDGTHVYVANDGSNTVSVIDTATNMVVATVAAGTGGPTGVAITPDGKHAYVANFERGARLPCTTGFVSVIATATNTVVKTIPVGPPLGSPSPRMGHTSTSRMLTPTLFL